MPTANRVPAACRRLQAQSAAFVAACAGKDAEHAGNDWRRRLGRLQIARTGAVLALARLPAVSDTDLHAKAAELLTAIDRLDPTPELELARSLAADVLRAGAQ